MDQLASWHDDLSLLGIVVGGAGMFALFCLIAVVRMCLNHRARRAVKAEKRDAAEPEAPEAAHGLLDIEFLDQLTSAAPQDKVAELFAAMRADCQSIVSGMRDAARACDFDHVQEESASLAESCEAFGAVSLNQKARNLFNVIEAEGLEDVELLIADIDKTAKRTFDAIFDHLKAKTRRRGMRRLAA